MHILNSGFHAFLKSRGFLPTFNLKPVKSVYFGLSFGNRFFLKTSTNVVFSLVNNSELKQYKCRLKTLVKSSYDFNCLQLIKSLNSCIVSWSKEFGSTSFYTSLSVSLDFYLYKLLWTWCKRFHPRRTNSWIFERYWTYISGRFRLC